MFWYLKVWVGGISLNRFGLDWFDMKLLNLNTEEFEKIEENYIRILKEEIASFGKIDINDEVSLLEKIDDIKNGIITLAMFREANEVTKEEVMKYVEDS